MYIMQIVQVYVSAANGLALYRKQIPDLLMLLLGEEGVKHVAFIGDEEGSALTMLQLIWESREAADTWMNGGLYELVLEGVRRHGSDVEIRFFSVEAVGWN
ncbi:MAG TPA: hypothetical protein VE422_30620 [Terriglobia bacterium]|nr:hypothetical protein [Terriglobia bacterium]